jgi:hypothetical protein
MEAPHTPSLAGECVPFPLVPGGDTLTCGSGGGGGSQFRRGDRHCGTLGIYVPCGWNQPGCSMFILGLGGMLSGGFAGWVAAHATEPTWCVVTWAQEVIIDVVWDKVQCKRLIISHVFRNNYVPVLQPCLISSN